MSDVKVKIKLKGAPAMGFLRNGAFGDSMNSASVLPKPKGGLKDAHQDKKNLDKKAKDLAAKRSGGNAGSMPGFRLPSARGVSNGDSSY